MLITYATKPNGQIDEQVGFTNNLKPNDLQMCNVILDYLEKRVLQCRVNGQVMDKDWERINGYYRQVYPELVGQLELTNQEKRDNNEQ